MLCPDLIENSSAIGNEPTSVGEGPSPSAPGCWSAPPGEPVEHQSIDLRGLLPMQKVAAIGYDLESIGAAELFRLAFHRFGPDVVGAAQRQSRHADRAVELRPE